MGIPGLLWQCVISLVTRVDCILSSQVLLVSFLVNCRSPVEVVRKTLRGRRRFRMATIPHPEEALSRGGIHRIIVQQQIRYGLLGARTLADQ